MYSGTIRWNKKLVGYPGGSSKNIKFQDVINDENVEVVLKMTPTNNETREPGMTYIIQVLSHIVWI